MLGLDPDKPIRLPLSRKALTRAGLAAFLVYLLVGCVVVTRDRGRPIDMPAQLTGCFNGDDGASACFDPTDEGVSLRITQGGRSLVMDMTSWRARKAFTIDFGNERQYLELTSLTYANSYGKVVVDKTIEAGDCRLIQASLIGSNTQWRANRDCFDSAQRLGGVMEFGTDTLMVDFTVDGKSFDVTLESDEPDTDSTGD